MASLFSGFKDFIMRGNVIELAVAVVIGTAFTALVDGIVEGLLNPLVALVAGRTDLNEVGAFTVNTTEFQPGLALDAALTFLLVAVAVYFFIMLPLNRVTAARAREEAAAETPALSADVVLLQEIRDLLARDGATTAPRSAPAATGPAATGSRTAD